MWERPRFETVPEHPDSPRLLNGPPPDLGLGLALGPDEVLAVGARDEEALRGRPIEGGVPADSSVAIERRGRRRRPRPRSAPPPGRR